MGNLQSLKPNDPPRLLDLFCGQGGAAMGYHRAGFEIVGVDILPQPRFPFEFVQGDALEYLAAHGRAYDVIHASPPCQRYSRATKVRPGIASDHPDLVGATRDALRRTGRIYVIENVMQAPLINPTMLCGLMFPELRVLRHRGFECSEFLWAPAHPTHRGVKIGKNGFCCVAGHGDPLGIRSGLTREERASVRTSVAWSRAMGIDWMSKKGMAQAIPPAYTEFIGKQLLQALKTPGGTMVQCPTFSSVR